MRNRSLVVRLSRPFALVLVASLLASCATYTPPRPQLSSIVEPAALPGAVRTAEWDIGGEFYGWRGQGINYIEAGVLPVLLLMRNHSGRYPVIYAQECRGIGAGGVEIMPYSMEQAAEVIFGSTAYKKSSEAAIMGGLTGAAMGAGLGALIGSGFRGGVGPGALIGAGVGMLGGATMTQRPSMDQYRSALYQEMATYAWRPSPIAPTSLEVGYLYFPANAGVTAVKVVVRDRNYVQSYVVPVSRPVW